MKEKYDNIQLGGNSQTIVVQIENIEANLSTLRIELDELKATALKDGALTETVELVRTLENDVKELEQKVTDLLSKPEPVVSSAVKEKVDEPVIKEEPIVEQVIETKVEPVQEPKEVITPIQSDLIEEDLTAKIYDIKIIENNLFIVRFYFTITLLPFTIYTPLGRAMVFFPASTAACCTSFPVTA